MKGSDIYYSVFNRCDDLGVDAGRFSELFYCAVLCMAPTTNATDHDIYRKYIERWVVRMGMVLRGRASASDVEEYNEPRTFLEPISFYLPKDTEIQNVHLDAYKSLTGITFELWVRYELNTEIRGLTAITTYLMGDIVESVRQLHAKFNKP